MNNRKLLTFVIFLFCSATISLSAQNFFKKGDQIVNVGIGLGSYYGGTGYSMTVPPLSVSYEKGLLDGLFDGKGAIGVGGYLGYQANKWETVFSGNSYGYKYNYIMVGARGTLHYQFVEKLDTYGGLLLGYDIVSSKFFGESSYNLDSATGSGIGYSAFVGARYQFTDSFCGFAELGYGISALQLGISFRL
ncbi:hypothetical protein [Petrimonas mucosa]|jgi:hypothetical protein|uniref:Outer membrane protein beta-barrel domain-containing protein n=1 Tax=Petrimonas mucosa TaxID=1642646 RepID=A0A1G4G3N9_9BACT|nr:hypothetical protein [Petrimonas mucosa]MDD3561271.1 hypothetical protein [Petrimonas mucosa]SCM55365.1 putative protein {ECO:0000313/EMBL:KGN80217,1} [Petrimonas mucosa]SFU56684.1 hypothetical protein SAMN05216364_102634 [Porphyromonadaceae bacterium KHP3R9]HHT29344.1 hypothetical protein [Petrimonas mucosa]